MSKRGYRALGRAVDCVVSGIQRKLRIQHRMRSVNLEALESRQLFSVPAIPTNLTVGIANYNQLSVSWTDASTNETSFTLDRATDATFTYDLTHTGIVTTTVSSTTSSGTGTGYNSAATGLLSNVTYYFRVRATNAEGSSSYSSTVSQTTPYIPPDPNVPGSLTATAVSATQINLTWSDPVNGTMPPNEESSFILERAINSSFTTGLTQITRPEDSTSYSDTGLTPLTTYYYRIRAINSYGASYGSNQPSAQTLAGSGQAPTVATPAAASPATVTGTSTALSALGADDGGEASLSYTWSVSSKPSGAADPTFSVNGTNAAKNSTATFSQAGSYSFLVTIKDAQNNTVTSGVSVSVNQTLSSITLSPATATVNTGATQQFTATGKDQFGQALSSQPTFTWSVDSGGVGTINSSGLYSAPSSGAGSATVRGTSGAVSGTAAVGVVVVNQTPTVATPAAASPSPVTGTTTALSMLGADDGGEASLSYTWNVTSKPSGAADPSFSVNGTNAAKNSTATFARAGSYTFMVTIKDAQNATVTSSVSVTVNQTLAAGSVAPATANVVKATAQQFTATALDQFGQALSSQPSFTWSIDAGGVGSISGSGATATYTAPSTSGGSATVRATAPGISATASVNVVERQVLAWVGGSSGDWGNAANWSAGRVPTANDDVVVSNAGSLTVTISSGNYAVAGLQFDKTLVISGGTLTVGNGATTATFGSGSSVTISGGTLNVATTATVSTGGTLNFANGTLTGAGTLSVNGTLNWTGSNGSTTMSGTGTTVIASGGVLNLSGTSNNKTLDTRTISNQGTLNASGAALYGYNGAVVSNSGTLNWTGDMSWYTGSGTPVLTNSGTLNKSGGTGSSYIYWQVNNTGMVTVSAGTLNLNGGGTESGSFATSSPGVLQFASGGFTVNGSAFSGSGSSQITGATLSVNTTMTVTTGSTLTLASGTLNGSGTLTVNGSMSWTGGTMSGSGATVVASGATLSISTTNSKSLDTRTLSNAGQIAWSGGTISGYNNAGITNSGSVVLSSDDSLSGSGTLTNSGTLSKSGGTGSSYINWPVNNQATGSVSVSSGTLNLNGGGTEAGAFTATGSGVLQFGGGTFTLNSGSSLGGSGNCNLSGATLTIPSGVNLPLNTTLNFANGTLTGAGTLSVNGTLNWTGSNGSTTMSGTGTTVIASGGVLNLSGTSNNKTLDTRTISNQGTLNASGAALYGYNGAVVSNSGTLNWTGDMSWYTGSGTPVLNNSGTLNKSGGTGSSYIYWQVNNTGTVTVSAGTLNVNGGGTEAGAFTATGTGVLQFGGGTFTLNSGASLGGSGNCNLSGATLTIPSGVNLPLNTTLNFASGTLTGAGTLSVNGTLNWTGSNGSTTMSGTGTTVIASGGVLNLSGTSNNKTLDTRTISNQGTLNASGAALYGYNAAVVSNSGTLNWTGDMSWYTGSGTPVLTNSGTLNKSGGTGSSCIYWQVNNTGTVTVSAGTLNLSGGGTSPGAFSATSPAILQFGGGTHVLSCSTISGTGVVQISGGTETLNGPLTVASGATLSIAGGAVTATGTWTVNGTLSVTGGTHTLTNSTFAGVGATQITGGTVTATSFVQSPSGSLSVAAGTLTLGTATTAANPVVQASTGLSVVGMAGTGEGSMTYTWSCTSKPTGAATPSFSATGNNAAKATTATFYQPGDYTFNVLISDGHLKVNQTLSLSVVRAAVVTISPASAIVPQGQTKQFSATVKDQFGVTMSDTPVWSILSGPGTISASGLYTAPADSYGAATIQAAVGSSTATATVTVVEAPTIAQAPAANPNPVTGTSASLSVLGAYTGPGGEATLSYSWTKTSGPGSVSLSTNGTNAAKTSTATFTMAGTYSFSVTITNPATGQSVTSSPLTVTVQATASSIAISPSSATVAVGGTKQFSATVYDQFNHAMSGQSVSWSCNTGGIDGNGLYTAPTDSGGMGSVTATCGSLSASANLTVRAKPTITGTPAATWSADSTNTQVTLSATGASDDPNVSASSLLYTWAWVSGPASASFSPNGTNAAQNAKATLSKAGTYKFKVKVSDGSLESDWVETAVVTVDGVLSSLKVSPSVGEVQVGGTLTFTASGVDQFGADMSEAPTVTWSVISGDGSITNDGTFTAPTTAGITVIGATKGSVSAQLQVIIGPAASLPAHFVLHGDYVAAGVGLRGNTSGTINLSGIPSGATVKAAYLFWGYLGNSEDTAFRQLRLGGTSILGVKSGSSHDTNWGRTSSYGYYANVTGLVTGNGSYAIAGVVSGGSASALAEGSSIVVVYEKADAAVRDILVRADYQVTYSPKLEDTLSGFYAYAAGSMSAKTTFIVGDGQVESGGIWSDTTIVRGSLGTMSVSDGLNSSDGGIWDTDTYDISQYVKNGDTSVYESIGDGTDCLMWVGQVISVSGLMPDLDIDSDNNNGFGQPDCNDAEDKIEDDTNKPGKILQVNDGDVDGDGIPDFADGYTGSYGGDYGSSGGVHFVPLVLQVPSGTDLSKAKFKFDYQAAGITNDDSGVKRTGSGTDADPYVYSVSSGFLRIWKKNGTGSRAASDFIQSGKEYSAADLGLTAGSPLTLYIETVKPSSTQGDQEIKVFLSPNGDGSYLAHDEVRVTATESNIAADNNRDDKITFDGGDFTSSSKPFLFWLNDKRCVWGGSDYPAVEMGNPSLTGLPSPSINGLGGDLDSKGNLVTDPLTLREVARADLENLAQVGLRWSKTLDSLATGYRIRLVTSDPGMSVMVFGGPSLSPIVLNSDSLSASSHVDDPMWIEGMLVQNRIVGETAGFPGVKLDANGVCQLTAENGLIGCRLNGTTGDWILPIFIEGVAAGTGRIVFEVMHDDQVLTSSEMNLRLRPIAQLYDHYTVAYGPNVDSNGCLKEIDLATTPNPVPTTANLLSGNQERDRIVTQSHDYFMFVHGWRMQRWERVSFAESAYKRMFWSGYQGQFGFFDWPTQWVSDAPDDPGNFDRSEFVAWNSAAGLVDALVEAHQNIPSDGKVSVMAHSMGNIVLGEALHQFEGQGQLVDTAIMSQAALSANYFTNSAVPSLSIYKSGSILPTYPAIVIGSGGSLTCEYRGFNPAGQPLDAIGGAAPRFDGIAGSAGKLLDYYNPDDYALASWKLDQALKPTQQIMSDGIGVIAADVDFKNVTFPFSFWTAVNGFFNTPSGYSHTGYVYVSAENRFYRVTYEQPTILSIPIPGAMWTEVSRTPLTTANDLYEMFAFCASSIVSPVGTLGKSAIGVFSDDRDLTKLSSCFNNQNTGHSAQFVGSYLGVQAYWKKLLKDIQ